MEFRKYQHIERLGSLEVDDILLGTCYVFPKIDGTNGSIWIDEGIFKAGSRNRELTENKDNANFYKSILTESQFDGIKKLLKDNTNYKIFGEWLIPHSLKTYRDEAWRKFYVFDIIVEVDENEFRYMKYEEYQKICEKYNINYIPCLKIIKNPTEERLYTSLVENDYLIKDGEGQGEGLVIKNYDFVNKFGRTIWAKIVTSEFKEKHRKVMGASEITEKQLSEDKIIETYCTEALVEKIYSKIVNEKEGWCSKFIPRLLETVFHDLVVECTYNAINKLKIKKIDFVRLKKLTHQKIKQVKNKLF